MPNDGNERPDHPDPGGDDPSPLRPAPLGESDVDLRSSPYTPMFRARLFGSHFHAHANDAEWCAGVTLWLKSWDQCPAGTLPVDDIDLCRLAALGHDLKQWHAIKAMALHGWIECSDDRMHHAVEAWTIKRNQRKRTENARQARLSQPRDNGANSSVTTSVTDSVTDHVTGSVTTSVTGSNRRE